MPTPLSSAAATTATKTSPPAAKVMLFGRYGCGDIQGTVEHEVAQARAEFESLRQADMAKVLTELKSKFDADTQKLAADCAVLKVDALYLLSGLGNFVKGLQACDQVIINTLQATETVAPSTKAQLDSVITVLNSINTALSLLATGLGVGSNLLNEGAAVGADVTSEKGTTQTLSDLATIVPTLTSGVAILQKTGALAQVSVPDLNQHLTTVITQAQAENAVLAPVVSAGATALVEAAKQTAAAAAVVTNAPSPSV